MKKKFISREGREAVFTQDFSPDGSYELVTDPRYKGTYNYCSPSFSTDNIFEKAGNGIGHFFVDMLPYYGTGNKNERNQ